MQEIGKRLRDDQWEKLPALFYWVNSAILVRPHRTISYFGKRCCGSCALVRHGKNSRSGQCAYPSELQSAAGFPARSLRSGQCAYPSELQFPDDFIAAVGGSGQCAYPSELQYCSTSGTPPSVPASAHIPVSYNKAFSRQNPT